MNHSIDSQQELQKISVRGEEAVWTLGHFLSSVLQSGDVVALIGDLGTGKTTLTKSIAAGLGVKELVTSPTFTIVHEYEGRLPLYHFDVYRIGDPDEMYELGYEEYFYGNGISIVEWADLVWDLIPKDALTVRIAYSEDPAERIYQIDGLEGRVSLEVLHEEIACTSWQ